MNEFPDAGTLSVQIKSDLHLTVACVSPGQKQSVC